MFKFKKPLRAAGFSLLLLTLVFFLTGCFDVYQEIWIGTDPEESTMRATFTTYSEEIFEMMKTAITADPEGGDVSFETVEAEEPEGETAYRIIQVVPPEEGMIFTFPYNGGMAYEMRLLSEEGDEEIDETTRELFEGHTYEVELHFPKPITDVWWGRVDSEAKTPVEEAIIEGNDFYFKTDLLEAMKQEFAYLTVVIRP